MFTMRLLLVRIFGMEFYTSPHRERRGNRVGCNSSLSEEEYVK